MKMLIWVGCEISCDVPCAALSSIHFDILCV